MRRLIICVYLAMIVCAIRALRYLQVWMLTRQLRSAERRMRHAVSGIQGARNEQIAHQIKANQLRGQIARVMRHLS